METITTIFHFETIILLIYLMVVIVVFCFVDI